MPHRRRFSPTTIKKICASFVIIWMSFLTPVAAFAQATDATGQPTGAPEATGAPAQTGAPECTGAGCGQGANQGAGQGTNQGGVSAKDLGADEQGNLPAGVTDTRQGAQQGASQGSGNGTTATNSTTGANSNNQTGVTTNNSATTGVTNTATNTTNANAVGSTGSNTSNANTGTGAITTGNAGIGVTQVVNDNTTAIGGTAGLQVSGHNGNHQGDLNLNFGTGTANLSNGSSVRATNDTTGSDSNNAVDVTTRTEEINEVQNDGQIDNLLNLAAITGGNQASRNTGDGTITTGDANVSATLVNLLNTTVVNGDIWIAVADIFGDLEGNINIPDFSSWLASYNGGSDLAIDAGNDNTGANSNNSVVVDIDDTETTRINNDADINTTVNAQAITGQNNTQSNTGGGTITTGNASATASNVSVANTTVEGGNWGLFIINALNGWFGFLVGENGQSRALSQEETLREIDARNTTTGSDSDNTITVDEDNSRTTTVDNDADINNIINASAITGQNEAQRNTGEGVIETGDANISATTVNIANTTVKDGSLFIAVVNIFGDWFGDLMYGGSSVTAAAAAGSNIAINADNTNTGADSTNTVDVDYNREHETTIDNEADLTTTLNATIDTGSNLSNRNTGGANIRTGNGFLALHSRAAANLTAIAGNTGLDVTINGLNGTTGPESTNRIRANINDNRIINVTNDANVSTAIGSVQNPALVNTGNNTANQNTLGALIVTGDASADVAIQNLVNQVLVALAGEGLTVDADFMNTLTGALSTNTNDLTVEQQTLLNVLNDGLISNLINLLLNTGGNKANENTDGASIASGDVCVDGTIENDVNGVDGKVKGTNTITQTGTVINDVRTTGTTGDNEMNRNTKGAAAGEQPELCPPKVAQAPTPSPTPGPGVGGPDGEGGGDGGGEEGVGGDGGEEAREPRVAGVTEEAELKPAKKGILQRFPVAGGENVAQLLQGQRRLPWQLFLIGSMGLLALAWHFDHKAKAKHIGQLA